MPTILPVNGIAPDIAPDCFVADNATIVGDVVIGSGGSIWFNAVIRGDVNKIRIGKDVNIQDGAVIHCTYEKTETHIGDRVSIGHNAIVHGCTVHPEVLIGMGAIVMDNAVIESHVLIAAGAVVLENSHLESGFIYGGIPAKKIKALDPEQFQFSITRTADNYKMYAGWFQK
jgi:carbonic anhydrase/acetyltransferase-like protein (isoleucine patch superfamily)